MVGDLEIFHVDTAADADAIAIALDWLDESEHRRRDRYLSELPRRQFTLCRAALRVILADRLGCPNRDLRFAAGERGKPFALVGGQRRAVSFNVSHSGEQGLIALAPRGRLGADVEERRTRRTIDQLIETLLTQAEQSRLKGLDQASRTARFYDLWAAKEALVKATGLGHAVDVARLDLSSSLGRPGESRRFQDPKVLEGRWQITNLGTPDFAAAVARELASTP